MNIKYVFLSVVFLLIRIKIIKAITINALAFTYTQKITLYNALTEAFNQYSQKNNLDIYLNLIILSPDNSTSYINNYGSTIDSLLSKQSNKYDVYFYYDAYTKNYGPHFLNLEEHFPKEHFDMFDPGFIRSSCSYNNKIVGLPVTVDVDVLYSNKKLLSKYNKEVPKTWEDLLETAKYILNEERKLNNTDLIGYNGLFNDSDEGVVSLYELIHSYRDSVSSPHPPIRSQNTVDALIMTKKLKNEIASDSIFMSGDQYTIEKLLTGNAIFLKFWYLQHDESMYTTTPLPGKKEGVSGSLVGGYNIGISKYLNDEKKSAAFEVLKFITSKETQRDCILKFHVFSGIKSLYEEEEVCKVVSCPAIKDAEPFTFMGIDTNEYNIDNVFEKYRKFLYEYLYENKSINEVLKKVDDITKYYYLTVKTDDSYVGLIILITFFVISFIMGLSLIFLFIKRIKRHFQFLPNDFWILSISGSFIYMCTIFTLYGDTTNLKCQLKMVLLSFGFILSLIPILYILIIHFPEDNEILGWIKEHRHHFLVTIIVIEILLNSLLFISPYNIVNVIISNGQNFHKCLMQDTMGINIFYLIITLDFIILLSILLLIFIEWNLVETYYYTRFLITIIAMDIVSLIIFTFISYIDINNYIAYNLILACNIFAFSISNYIFIYGVRLISPSEEGSEIDMNEQFIKKYKQDQNNYVYSISSEGGGGGEYSYNSKSDYSSELSSFHYRTSNSITNPNSREINISLNN
ncbi:periplasmic binding protein-like II [Anaeromyces robustus]|uniref:Periplasmic binding protein-like II n=1 Tax=Anaeromyces robustus TaxID=1754192 RepID=A0A1Y1X0L6_9FUNG|nr:periplasmic binding protein-like II [Anaeromyces robustus]|eukprot:ORX79252.1 periplasmic binding protein-like II [Anaeromyces robustus]